MTGATKRTKAQLLPQTFDQTSNQMNPLMQSVSNIRDGESILRERPYGMIECRGGKLIRIRLKPWPKMASIVEARWMSGWRNRRREHDVCRLYYNQPMLHRNYLALSFMESTPHTRLKTVCAALSILDTIASIKMSHAILAEVTNAAISDRALIRFGWQPHLEHSRHRHWIKRFYGKYPTSAGAVFSETQKLEQRI